MVENDEPRTIKVKEYLTVIESIKFDFNLINIIKRIEFIYDFDDDFAYKDLANKEEFISFLKATMLLEDWVYDMVNDPETFDKCALYEPLYITFRFKFCPYCGKEITREMKDRFEYYCKSCGVKFE